MKINDRIGGVSRRDFFKVAGTYGLAQLCLLQVHSVAP